MCKQIYCKHIIGSQCPASCSCTSFRLNLALNRIGPSPFLASLNVSELNAAFEIPSFGSGILNTRWPRLSRTKSPLITFVLAPRPLQADNNSSAAFGSVPFSCMPRSFATLQRSRVSSTSHSGSWVGSSSSPASWPSSCASFSEVASKVRQPSVSARLGHTFGFAAGFFMTGFGAGVLTGLPLGLLLALLFALLFAAAVPALAGLFFTAGTFVGGFSSSVPSEAGVFPRFRLLVFAAGFFRTSLASASDFSCSSLIACKEVHTKNVRTEATRPFVCHAPKNWPRRSGAFSVSFAMAKDFEPTALGFLSQNLFVSSKFI